MIENRSSDRLGPSLGRNNVEPESLKNPVDHIRTRLLATEKVIRDLKEELTSCRSQYAELLRENRALKNKLQEEKTESRVDSQRENDWRLMKRERDQLAEVNQSQSAEMHELKEYSAHLERLLNSERDKLHQSQEVIIYLEAQITQLEAIIAMLQSHQKFMAEK